MRFDELASSRVAVLGLGIEAHALCAAWCDRLPGQPLTILTNSEAAPEDITYPHHIVIETGPVTASRLSDFDVVVKSPGFSPYRDPVAGIVGSHTQLTSASAIWFAENPDARTVCITGTKGKSTTSALLAHILSECGIDCRLAGNIGHHMFEFDCQPPPSVWIIEVSSYQAWDFGGHPDIGVVLNLFPEHLDWHLTEDQYFHDKLGVLRQIETGTGVVNAGNPKLMQLCPDLGPIESFNDPTAIHSRGEDLYAGSRSIFSVGDARLKGPHNRENICAALTVARLLGLDLQQCQKPIHSFSGLAHRQFHLGTSGGFDFIDDSLSTTPHATMAAITTLQERDPGTRRPLTVLLGGHDRGLSWQEFGAFIIDNPVHAVVTMPANGARIATLLRATTAAEVHEVDDLEHAVATARSITPEGGIILLSPGAPSYGVFRNYAERGRRFAELAGLPATEKESLVRTRR